MRFWRRLTARGKAVALFSLVVSLLGLISWQAEIFGFGIFLVALTVVALALASVPLKGLGHRREISQTRVSVDDEILVKLSLWGTRRAAGHLLHFEEVIPPFSGLRPRFGQVAGLKPWQLEINYQLKTRLRGEHQIGPLLVRSFDPFGLARQDLAFTLQSRVRVAPVVWVLSDPGLTAGGQSSESTPLAQGIAAMDDVLVRPYQRGDDRRRLHWRASAHTGELMVRREENSWRPTIRLLFDNRLSAHAGVGPDSSLEWAISLFASIGDTLLASGFNISCLNAEGSFFSPAQANEDARDELIERLIDLRPTSIASLAPALTSLTSGGRLDSCYAILGACDANELALLSELADFCTKPVAFLLDTASFAEQFEAPVADALPTAELAKVLAEHGWQVVSATSKDLVPLIWQASLALGGRS